MFKKLKSNFSKALFYFPLLVAAFIFTGACAEPKIEREKTFGSSLAEAAFGRTKHIVHYDGAYRSIPYPNGDVSSSTGVCTDVIIRSYRVLGIDLQQLVHEDMKAYFSLYPKRWGLRRPDTNIDHRRVPNLQKFFTRFGQSLGTQSKVSDYKPGDLVTWDLNTTHGIRPHIGIVSDRIDKDNVPLIIHNIGMGPQIENVLYDYKITGHYRYSGKTA